MKKVILARFGDHPVKEISEALVPHINGKAIAFPAPGVIISVFNTESELSQIADALKPSGAMFLLMEANHARTKFPNEIEKMIEAKFPSDEVVLERGPRIYTMDELLDMVHANGIESLTEDQKKQLDELSV